MNKNKIKILESAVALVLGIAFFILATVSITRVVTNESYLLCCLIMLVALLIMSISIFKTVECLSDAPVKKEKPKASHTEFDKEEQRQLEMLGRFKQLKDDGIISAEEFEIKKNKILDEGFKK